MYFDNALTEQLYFVSFVSSGLNSHTWEPMDQ